MRAAAPPRSSPAPAAPPKAKAPSSSVQGATGETLGELFAYNFAGPVTIKKNESAMLPFLQDKIAARKLLIYGTTDGEHPVNAAEITNNTGKTLDGGPITVYDGAYAGEALVETFKAGDKRLIGYAIDYGTRVTSEFESSQQRVREVHAHDGMAKIHYGVHDTRTYLIRNVDPTPKTLIIEQPGVRDYTVVSPKPMEQTATAYRFEARVPANGSQKLKVEQERTTLDEIAVSSASTEQVLDLVSNKQLSELGKAQLQAVLDLKRRLAETSASLDAAKSQTTDLTNDETRLRQNIDSLNRVKGQEDQVKKYSADLATTETDLAKLRDQTRSLTQAKAALDTRVRDAIGRLEF
jgi:hypothetical protein